MAGSRSTYFAGSWMISACTDSVTGVFWRDRLWNHSALWIQALTTLAATVALHPPAHSVQQAGERAGVRAARLELALDVRAEQGLGDQRVQRRVRLRRDRQRQRALVQPVHHLRQARRFVSR